VGFAPRRLQLAQIPRSRTNWVSSCLVSGERPDVGFEGTAYLLKDNWPAIIEALGPKLAETKQEYERREQVSRESFERLQSRYTLTPRGFVYKMKKTAAGRVLFRLLRLAEVALILWAIYTVLNQRGG